MLHVNVLLPSGRNEILSLPESSKVGDLRILAQKSLGIRHFLKFVSAGQLLEDPDESLTTALQGDSVTALAVQLKMASTDLAFALWRCGGERLVTWGDAGHGGDSSAVPEICGQDR